MRNRHLSWFQLLLIILAAGILNFTAFAENGQFELYDGAVEEDVNLTAGAPSDIQEDIIDPHDLSSGMENEEDSINEPEAQEAIYTEMQDISMVGAGETAGKCGPDLTWRLTVEGGVQTIRISGTGEMYDYDDWAGTIFSFDDWGGRENVRNVIIENGVTSIGKRAFDACDNLTDIIIPDSVISIGENAFEGCLQMTDIIIPDSVRSIGNGAFAYCRKLKSISIPDSVISIGDSVFEECSDLVKIKLSQGLTAVSKKAFRGCIKMKNVTLPGRITVIDDGAFWGCTGLESIVIPDGVMSIGDGAFAFCEKLKSLMLPNSVSQIGGFAFRGCSGLNEIGLSERLTSIERCLFLQCVSLKNVTVPKGVKKIAYGAFAGCSSLNSVSIPDSVTDIGEDVFSQIEGRSVGTGSEGTIYLFDKNISTLTIYGYSGSRADSYSAEKGIPFVSIGESSPSIETETTAPTPTPQTVVRPVKAAVTGLLEKDIGKIRMQAQNRGTQVDGYQFEWSLDKNLKTGVKTAATKKHYYYRSGLIGGKTYYVRARTFRYINGRTVYSNWSGIKEIKLERRPAVPVIVKLKKNSTGFSVRWNTISGVNGYQIRYSASPDFSEKKTVSITGAGKSALTKKNLVKGQTYFVSIRAFMTSMDGTKFYSDWSPARTITL